MKLFFTLICFFSVTLVSAQWTWMKGTNNYNKYGIYGTKGVASTGNRPGTRELFFSWKDNAGNFWIYGGYGLAQSTDGQLSDLWKFDPTTNNWTWVSGDSIANVPAVQGTKGVAAPTNKPGAKHSGTGLCDALGRFWLFGGANLLVPTSGFQMYNDLWRYDPVTNQWTWMKGEASGYPAPHYGTMGISDLSNTPGDRADGSGWADAFGNLYFFGGQTRLAADFFHPTYTVNELWKYSTETNKWTWLKGVNVQDGHSIHGIRGVAATTNTPSARSGAAGSSDAQGNMWLFGGWSFDNQGVYGPMNDLWKYAASTNEWTWVNGDTLSNNLSIYGSKGIAASSNRPGGKTWAASGTDLDGNFWVFGGRGDAASGTTATSTAGLNDLWLYKPATDQWTWLSGDSTINPAAIFGVQGVLSANNKPGWKELQGSGWTDQLGNFWVFGGQGSRTSTSGSGQLGDLWRYTPLSSVPVSLISFTAVRDREIAKLYWNVEQELNLDRYEIERSFNGRNYEKTGEVKAVNAKQYSFNDHSKEIAGKTIYYQLKMVDADGKYSYSKIIVLNIAAVEMIRVSPNPATTQVKLHFNENITGKVDMHILDLSGRLVTKESYTVTDADHIISTDKLSGGTYVIHVFNKGNKYFTRIVVAK